MEQVDYYSGQPLYTYPPQPMSEAEQMASFGKYGYSSQPVQQQNYAYQPQQGIGMGQAGYNQYGQSQMNPNSFYSRYYQPNPVFSMNGGGPGYQQQYAQQQPPVAQNVTYNIAPKCPWGNIGYINPDLYEDEYLKILWDAWWKEQTDAIENDNKGGLGYGFNNNFYGNGYYNNYMSSHQRAALDQINQMNEEIREDKISFYNNISKLAHNHLGLEYDEIKMKETMFTGTTVTVPGMTSVDIYQNNRLHNLVPFDNSEMYRRADAEVSAQFYKHIDPHSNMNQFLDNLALWEFDCAMEEEKHRRNRELGLNYDHSAYRAMVREKAREMKIEHKIEEAEKQIRDLRDHILESGLVPTLAKSAKMEDGVLKINYNFDPNEVYTEENMTTINQIESQYGGERNRFLSFLNALHNIDESKYRKT